LSHGEDKKIIQLLGWGEALADPWL
jgi:hypothetical protein